MTIHVAMFASSLIMGFGVCCGSQEVKIGASDIVKNLHFPNGTAIIPPGSVVYVSTDDPDGICKNCLFNRKPCDTYPSPKPVGCPEDVSDSLRVTTILLPCMYSPVHLHCLCCTSRRGKPLCKRDGRFASYAIIKRRVTSPMRTPTPSA